MSFNLFENKNTCCGCGGCKNVCPKNAITMQSDENGFLYPHISDDCIGCGLCKKFCNFQKETEFNENISVYAAKANDDIRMKSTSGGAFTVFSDEFLENDGVVYGVALDDKFKALHIRAEDKEARDLCRISKYIQSDMQDIFIKVKEDLSLGKKVMFTGTPCQTEAIKNFFAEKERENLLLVEILCHGVMSPKLFLDYLAFIEKRRKKKVKGYFHRSKEHGWGDPQKVEFFDNTIEMKTPLLNVWKNMFYSDTTLRPSCYNCKYATESRCADITIADFWGINVIKPEFYDKKGVSLILVNSEKGKAFFDTVKDKFILSEHTMEEAKMRNPNLYTPTRDKRDAVLFWKEYHSKGFVFVAKKYGGYSLYGHLKQYARRILKGK